LVSPTGSLVRPCPLLERRLKIQRKEHPAIRTETARGEMGLNEPAERFLFAQVVGETLDRSAALLSSQFQPRVSIDDLAVPCDHDWLSECQVTPCNEIRQ